VHLPSRNAVEEKKERKRGSSSAGEDAKGAGRRAENSSSVQVRKE